MTDAEARATRRELVLNILVGHCGQTLTPRLVESLAAQFVEEIEHGPCAGAFQKEVTPFDQLQHVAVHADRISPEALARGLSQLEKDFADAWRWENRLFDDGRFPHTPQLVCTLGLDPNIPVSISQRDATVAASVIQWLGTNVGQAFIRHVESGWYKEFVEEVTQ